MVPPYMEWDIGNTALVCASCGKSFGEGQPIFSVLCDEPEGMARRDYCSDCRPPVGDALGFWHTRIPARDDPVKRFVDDEVIMDLFRRLEGHSDPRKRNFRYVLSLLLMRKKTLKFVEFKRADDGDRLLLSDRVSDATHVVMDPNLTEEEIRQVTDEIGQILNFKVSA